MYSGSLADAVQLAVSINCLTLLVIITAVYFIYFKQTGEQAFHSGGIVTLNVMLFVLAETLIIITGWYNAVPLGRHLYRAEQIGVFLFLSSMPYFLLRVFPSDGVFKKILEFLFWVGLALTAAVTASAYIFPDSLVSVTAASSTPAVSPGDFTRGLEGPLFRLRDIMLAFSILIALVYSVYYMLKVKRNFQSVLLFCGIIAAIAGGVDDMQYVYSGKNFLLSSFRFSRFVTGVTIMLMFFLAAVFSRYFRAHTLLEKTTQELKVSEDKYSLLMEAADEIMFSLSDGLFIISANKKAEKLFQLDGEPLNFMDCLYMNEVDDENKDNQYYREQLQELRDEGDRLSFNTYIKDWVTFEPVEYHFRFDCFHNGDDLELIGRAWPAAASKLTEYIGSERLSLGVENYITMVGDIVDRLTNNIRKFLDESEVMMIKMGLNEMIVNAMEHGNLNVTFDEKTQAQEEGRLFDFMAERRQQPEYRDKKVLIDYHLDESKVIYRITDMGPGFDYKKIMDRVKNEVNQQGLTHGRGIIMTQAVFTDVQYNSRGNQVLLVKEFNSSKEI